MNNLLIILSLFFSLCTFGQDQKQDSIAEFEKTFYALSYDDFEYKMNYMKDKKMLYFEIIDSGKAITAYKLLINDIHPKGIFLYEDDGNYLIRILSLNNGNVFIKDNLDKKYRYSNTTNYVDIGIWDNNFKHKLMNFVSIFRKFIESNKKDQSNLSNDDEIIIVIDKKK